MGLQKLVSRIRLHRGAAALSGVTGALVTSGALTQNPGTSLVSLVGAFTTGYIACVLFRNTAHTYDMMRTRIQDNQTFFQALRSPEDKRLAKIYSSLNDCEESFELDKSAFDRLEEVYARSGIRGIATNPHLRFYGTEWALVTGRYLEYQNAMKFVERDE